MQRVTALLWRSTPRLKRKADGSSPELRADRPLHHWHLHSCSLPAKPVNCPGALVLYQAFLAEAYLGATPVAMHCQKRSCLG